MQKLSRQGFADEVNRRVRTHPFYQQGNRIRLYRHGTSKDARETYAGACAYFRLRIQGVRMSYFVITAVRIDHGHSTHVSLRALDEKKPMNARVRIKMREGAVVPVAEVVERIRHGDTVYIGRIDPRDLQIALGIELRLHGDTQLLFDPPEALQQLPRI
ncbi:MAG: hypothetical protein EOP13_07550 [Pseudomonas sp.]|uniref:hypothetical protein n=1 Tax=Pseudomonas sp. TaxID=306 RepID=UPI001220F727|nr:hypothetical protein [Pseudomonas sp.]RZI74790.1 MAG: hypothetical protein EOP13_07550 [Pseudomonas sp.]